MSNIKPQTVIVDGVSYTLVEGHIYVNGRVYVPTAKLPENYTPPKYSSELLKKLEQIAYRVGQFYRANHNEPLTVEEMVRVLHHDFNFQEIPTLLETAVDAGLIQHVAGTRGPTAQYLPINQGN